MTEWEPWRRGEREENPQEGQPPEDQGPDNPPVTSPGDWEDWADDPPDRERIDLTPERDQGER
jgi:hypothetical protein